MSFQYLNIARQCLTFRRCRIICVILFQYFMDKQIKNILKNPMKLLSETTEIDIYSKKIGLLEQSSMLIDSIIKNKILGENELNDLKRKINYVIGYGRQEKLLVMLTR